MDCPSHASTGLNVFPEIMLAHWECEPQQDLPRLRESHCQAEEQFSTETAEDMGNSHFSSMAYTNTNPNKCATLYKLITKTHLPLQIYSGTRLTFWKKLVFKTNGLFQTHRNLWTQLISKHVYFSHTCKLNIWTIWSTVMASDTPNSLDILIFLSKSSMHSLEITMPTSI